MHTFREKKCRLSLNRVALLLIHSRGDDVNAMPLLPQPIDILIISPQMNVISFLFHCLFFHFHSIFAILFLYMNSWFTRSHYTFFSLNRNFRTQITFSSICGHLITILWWVLLILLLSWTNFIWTGSMVSYLRHEFVRRPSSLLVWWNSIWRRSFLGILKMDKLLINKIFWQEEFGSWSVWFICTHLPVDLHFVGWLLWLRRRRRH